MGRSIQLEATKCKLPACEGYEDEARVIAFERAMRTYQAHAERYQIFPPESGVRGSYRVAGRRGRFHWVDILDPSAKHDCCNCPDFLSNGIGTCKHLEAVRRYIQEEKLSWMPASGMAEESAYPVLTVDGMTGRLVLAGHAESTTLQSLGLRMRNGLLEASRHPWPKLDAIEEAGIRATRSAAAVLEKESRHAREEDRRRAFQNDLDFGRAGVDILRLPLFSYQETGVRHLATSGRALLADDVGLGKKVQAIAACEVLRKRGEAQSIFIVAPACLKEQWAEEIRKFTGEEAVVLPGRPVRRGEAIQGDAPYKILSYELSWRELSRLQDFEPDVLVLDEAHRGKNYRTRTADALRAIPSRFLFVLTGTPVENRLEDLFSLMQLIDPDVFGPLWRFNIEFHQQDLKGRVVGTKNMTQLRERIAPYVLRRRKEEVLDQVPSLSMQTRFTPLSLAQSELEETFRRDALRYLQIAEHRNLNMDEQQTLSALLLKGRQVCSALELCEPRREEKASPKLEEFEALINEIASAGNHKTVVFSEWVEMLNLAAERLDKLEIGWKMLTGRVAPEKRTALLDTFRHDPTVQVLLCSDGAASGLNLQTAGYVIHLELPWNPAKLEHRNSRAHRLGQSRGVNSILLCASSGIERGMESVMKSKLATGVDVGTLEAQGFNAFLYQLGQVLNCSQGWPGESETEEGPAKLAEKRLEGLDLDAEPIAAGPVVPPVISGLDTASGDLCVNHEGDPVDDVKPAELQENTAEEFPPRPMDPSTRALNRLRLAKVVLEAGFPTDALRAAYEALVNAVVDRLKTPPEPGHVPLVAAIYKELIPAGRLPLAVPGSLARLHDLTTLEAHGVEPDLKLVRLCVEEVEHWLDRLIATDEAGA